MLGFKKNNPIYAIFTFMNKMYKNIRKFKTFKIFIEIKKTMSITIYKVNYNLGL